MAEVRSSAGVPAASEFGGLGAPSPGTPLVVDATNGALYALIAEAVTPLCSSGIRYGAGVPSDSIGADGNFYFRSDGGVGSNVYKKAAGTWGAIL